MWFVIHTEQYALTPSSAINWSYIRFLINVQTGDVFLASCWERSAHRHFLSTFYTLQLCDLGHNTSSH